MYVVIILLDFQVRFTDEASNSLKPTKKQNKGNSIDELNGDYDEEEDIEFGMYIYKYKCWI